MSKIHKRFEMVPVETVEKLLNIENAPAKRTGRRKPVAKKSKRTAAGPAKSAKKPKVLTS
jgi:hypothetical protein